MKNWILVFLLPLFCISSFCVYGQETKFILRKDKGTDIQEEYYVLKDNKKIKHGTYVKYIINRYVVQILESGNYENGKKDGKWYLFFNTPSYYHSKQPRNVVKEEGNYENGKKSGEWYYYYLDTIQSDVNVNSFGNEKKIDSIEVNIDRQQFKIKLVGSYLNGKRVGEWTSYNYYGKLNQRYDFSESRLIMDLSLPDSLRNNNKNRYPLFIGGEPVFLAHFSDELAFEKIFSKINQDTTFVKVLFHIDKNGSVSEPTVSESNGPKVLEKEAIRLINSTNNLWIPAVENGEVVDSDYNILININRKTAPNNRKISFYVTYTTFFQT